jgi:hypothetical protein
MADRTPRESVRRPLPIPTRWKDAARDFAPTRDLWGALRARRLLDAYITRREHYEDRAREMKLAYDPAAVTASVRARLAARGYTPARRSVGEVHTFACVPEFSWHRHLIPDLEALGPVSRFDYCAMGYGVLELTADTDDARRRRREMLAGVLPAFREIHAKRPVDWVFCYGGGQDTSPAVIRELTEAFGVPTVNMSLDDKQGWVGRDNGECRSGACDITRAFDLYMTSARVCCNWHLVEGGRPIYLPEGVDVTAFAPRALPRDLPVSFVGAAYGFRRSFVDELRRFGVDVRVFGSGWPDATWVDDPVDVFNRSAVNLGMGGIEYSESLTNVKGRDFEIPGVGGGVYLTSFNPDLAQHFDVGREIVCYRNREEALELIRHLVTHRDEADAIARAGRARCVREHRWLHRYEAMLRVLGVLDP